MFVAGFIGSPAMNLFTADLVEGGVKFGEYARPARRATVPSANGKQVTIGVRPEDLEVSTTEGDGLPVVVDLVEELGADGYLYGHADSTAGAPTSSLASTAARTRTPATPSTCTPSRTTPTCSTWSPAPASRLGRPADPA